jgi:hypothetical protein
MKLTIDLELITVQCAYWLSVQLWALNKPNWNANLWVNLRADTISNCGRTCDCIIFGAVALDSKANSTPGLFRKIWDSNMFEPPNPTRCSIQIAFQNWCLYSRGSGSTLNPTAVTPELICLQSESREFPDYLRSNIKLNTRNFNQAVNCTQQGNPRPSWAQLHLHEIPGPASYSCCIDMRHSSLSNSDHGCSQIKSPQNFLFMPWEVLFLFNFRE